MFASLLCYSDRSLVMGWKLNQTYQRYRQKPKTIKTKILICCNRFMVSNQIKSCMGFLLFKISKKLHILTTRFVGTFYPSALRHYSPYNYWLLSHSTVTLLYLPCVYVHCIQLTHSEVYIQIHLQPQDSLNSRQARTNIGASGPPFEVWIMERGMSQLQDAAEGCNSLSEVYSLLVLFKCVAICVVIWFSITCMFIRAW
jgi:hypothetical protein